MADSKPLTGAEGTPDTKPGADEAPADGTGSSEQVNIKVRLKLSFRLYLPQSGHGRWGGQQQGLGAVGGGAAISRLYSSLSLSLGFERPSMSRW